jgi:hypothetical protein
MAKPPPKAISSVRRLARSAIYSRRHHPGASSLPQCGPQVLGANLKCSESRYGLATNALATGRPEGLYLGGLQPLGARSPFGPATVGRRRGRHKRGPDRPQLTDAPIDAARGCRPRAWPVTPRRRAAARAARRRPLNRCRTPPDCATRDFPSRRRRRAPFPSRRWADCAAPRRPART